MKSPLVQNTANSTKTLAQSIAKKVAREPIEILKAASEQTLGGEVPGINQESSPKSDETQQKKLEEQKRLNDNMKSTRLVEALNRELGDIRKQDVFDDLQRRISEGEEVPLENYSELSMEQKQVLKAQMEAVRIQKANSLSTQESFTEPAAKKGRQLFNFGKKTAVKREQTHVEKPVPPSG